MRNRAVRVVERFDRVAVSVVMTQHSELRGVIKSCEFDVVCDDLMHVRALAGGSQVINDLVRIWMCEIILCLIVGVLDDPFLPQQSVNVLLHIVLQRRRQHGVQGGGRENGPDDTRRTQHVLHIHRELFKPTHHQ